MQNDNAVNISYHTDNEKLYMGAISRLPSMEITNFYAFRLSTETF